MKITENPYYSSDRISNSKLSLINPEQGGSPALYRAVNAGEMEKKEHLSLERGKLVHLFLLEPAGFIVADVEKPSPAIQAVIDDMYRNGDSSKGFTESELLLAASRTGFQSRWGDEARLKQLDTKQNKEYFNFLIDSKEYLFLSSNDKKIVESALSSVSKHPYANLLINGNEWDGYECYNELAVESQCTVTGFGLKGLLDRVMIDHMNKKIIIPDLKTTSKAVDSFTLSYVNYRYYRQHAFYGYLIETSDMFGELVKKGYRTEYKSVVVNINPNGLFETRVFDIHPDFIQMGRSEYTSLLERIGFAEVFGWEYPKEHWEQHTVTGRLEFTLKPDM
jgi:hypothetical protein